MSFFKKLFSFGGAGAGNAAAGGPPVEYGEFTIRPAPYQEGGQYQVAGLITKTVGGVVKEHRFVRADRYPSADIATEVALAKARLIVDEQGDRMFD